MKNREYYRQGSNERLSLMAKQITLNRRNRLLSVVKFSIATLSLVTTLAFPETLPACLAIVSALAIWAFVRMMFDYVDTLYGKENKDRH